MPVRSALVGFFIKLLIINAVLLLPWPAWRDLYATGFRAAANVLLGSIGRDGIVRFEPGEATDVNMDSRIVLQNRSTQAQSHVAFNCRFAGWLPTAMTAALVLATPLPWRRKLAALAAGLALVHLFIALRLWVYLAYLFSAGDTLAVFAPGPFVRGLLGAISDGLFASLIGSFLGPILIWLVVAVRPRDWSSALESPRSRGRAA
jgi:hypothetical protein